MAGRVALGRDSVFPRHVYAAVLPCVHVLPSLDDDDPAPLREEAMRFAVNVVVYAMTRGGTAVAWQEGILAGITLAMATLPEEFPVVLTVFLALGAWRISRSRVLTRRMPAVDQCHHAVNRLRGVPAKRTGTGETPDG